MKTEEYFRKDAKTIIDMLFDTKCFKDNITRDNLNDTESFISDMMSMKFKSQEKFKELSKSLSKK